MINKKLKINKNIDSVKDKKISIALMAPFVILTMQYFILIYFNMVGTSSANTVQLISKALVGIAFLFALPSMFKRSMIKFIGVYFVAVFIFMFHYIVFPENQSYLKEFIFPMFFINLPSFIYALSIRDWLTFKKIMKKSSYIVFLVGAILGLLIFSGKSSAGSYSMPLSYYMLLPIIIFLDELLEKFSLRIFLFTSISLLVILALGSRGAILCIIVFIFLKLIKPNKKFSFQISILYTVIFGVGFTTYLLLDKILGFLYEYLLNFGIKSRTILLFLRQEVHLSGRDEIYSELLKEVANNFLIGLGIGGDRLVRGGGYAHNLFLEIIIDFGVFSGAILIFLICGLILKFLFIKNINKYNVFIIWLSLGFVHLMVSSSYIIDMKFWIFLGVSINLYSEKSNKNIKI